MSELNRHINTSLGWRVVPRKVSPLYDVKDDTVYDLYAPTGKLSSVGTTEFQAWNNAPDHQHSLDAIEANMPRDWCFTVEKNPTGDGLRATIVNPLIFRGYAFTRPEALAIAFDKALGYQMKLRHPEDSP